MKRPWLAPLVPLYAVGAALRAQSQTPRRLAWPVVSVGNLSTGGAGKTPLTIALAQLLSAYGVAVDILSRGYGRRSTEPSRVQLGGSAQHFGDEPLLIARATGLPVYVAPERYDAGLLAESGHAAQGQQKAPGSFELHAHILDDGFQHRQLTRAVDILLLSRDDLADTLLPAGNLREPLHAAQRAHVLAVPTGDPALDAELRARGLHQPIWRIRRRMAVPHVAGPVLAFCGIAHPQQFFAGLEAAEQQLAARRTFRDHHVYTTGDLAQLVSAARRAGASALLTTEKDAVRLGPLASTLPPELPLLTAGLTAEIEDAPAALAFLLARLRIAG